MATKWEHKIIYLIGNDGYVKLHEAGAQGWEAVGFSHSSTDNTQVGLLKRPLQAN